MKVTVDKSGNGNFCDIASLNEFIENYEGDSLTVEFVKNEYYGSLTLSDPKASKLEIVGNGSAIVGKNVIDCNFRRYDKNKIVADVGKGRNFERVMIFGKNMVMARYPKYEEDKILNGCRSMAELEERIKGWKEGSCGFLRSLHVNEWGGNSYRFEKSKGKLNLSWVGDNNRGSDFDRKRVVAEGVFEELNGENEWFYNSETGELFLYCADDFACQMQIGLLDKIDLLSIENCKNTSISISGLDFCDSERSAFKGNWRRYLRSDWAFNDKAAVHIADSCKIRFSGCRFENLGATAILIENDCDTITIDDCSFCNCLSNGVLILGDKGSTYCTSSWEGDNHKTVFENAEYVGAKTRDYPNNITVADSYFYNLGIEDKQSCAVSISLASRVTVKNCTIHRMPRAGINICENAFGGHTVSGNDIFDCVRETGDHGPFNSWGRDRFWSLKKFTTMGKYGESKRNYYKADMPEKNTICENRIVGARGFGIDLDDGSSQYDIRKNLCFGVGIKLREGFDRTVTNNVIVNAPLDLHATFARNDDDIFNNVVFHNAPLNVVLLNKGHTTKLRENRFAGCSGSAVKNKFKGRETNAIVDLRPNDILAQNFNITGFEKLPERFGKNGAPQPSLNFDDKVIMIEEYRFFGNKFVSIDETLRSLCGLPNYEGAYVANLSPLSAFRRAGVVAGDVVAAINGMEIKTPKEIENFRARTLHSVTVFRNQTRLTVKRK